MNLSEQEHYSKGALGQKGRQHSNGQGMADGGAWPAAGLQEGQFPGAMKEYRETRLNEEADSTREMAQGEKRAGKNGFYLLPPNPLYSQPPWTHVCL